MAAVRETGDGWLEFTVVVRVPRSQAPVVADAMTGNDDDIVLAAETAMRERIEEAVVFYDTDNRIELAPVSEKVVKEFLADALSPGGSPDAALRVGPGRLASGRWGHAGGATR